MSLISYAPDDPSFFTHHPGAPVRNLCGSVGAAVAGFLRYAIGLTGYLVAGVGFLWAIARFNGISSQRPWVKGLSTLFFCVAVSALLSLLWIPAPDPADRGGVVGLLVGDQMTHYFGWWGAVVILLTIGLLGFLLVTEMAFLPVVEWITRGMRRQGIRILEKVKGMAVPSPVRVHLHTKLKVPSKPEPPKAVVLEKEPLQKESRPPEIRIIHPEPPKKIRATPPPVREIEPAPVQLGEFKLPSLDLLEPPAATSLGRQGKESLQQNAKILEEALRDFGIEAKVAEVEMGPVITRYEVELAPGVKVQKITGLSDDLALILKSPSVRIIAPIPGKARVGIEAPNAATTLVGLREVLESEEFRSSSSKLTIALGKDAAGHPLVADLAEMPHLLVAGTTGSGKTVCMNALITSILFNATPEEVRFLMVDPKRVELAPFNGLPHLILPVLTDAKQVPVALGWVVQEMETRYRLFAKLGVRNIDAYHERKAAGQLPTQEIPEHLPHLVVIIDELADLMLVAQAEIERTIARLAHLSRAVGIHMVLATQRPSVDVLTGVIKANLPARVSFQVASKVDSRTVLDTMGAEKLLGKGDLLFMQPGTSKLIRAQGTLVTDREIERVVQFLKEQRPAAYDTSILEEQAQKGPEGLESIRDPLYPEAVRIVIETGQASVSLLQRRMRLGYGRAARILDRMEQEGIVGPIRGAKPREVYLKEVPEITEVVG